MKIAKIEMIRSDVMKRLGQLEVFLKDNHYPIISRVIHIDSQDCYEIFGVSNKSLESIEYLQSLLINSLYDDSDMAFTHQNGGWFIGFAQDHPNRLNEAQLTEILDAFDKHRNFYVENKDVIEEHDWENEYHNTIYFAWSDLRKQREAVMKKYGWDKSDFAKQIAKEFEDL